MIPEQKPKSLNLAIARLILAGIFVFVICFATVLGVAGYLKNNKSVVNREPAVSIAPEVSIKPDNLNYQDSLEWLKQLIAKEENGEVANPPASLSKCIYKGNVVYYLPQKCCDISSILYNTQGEEICAPDGGFSGWGDGRCTDFLKEKNNCEIIWQDSRSYSLDPSFICGVSEVTDIDNNIYNTVQVGEQCWLKENLKVTKNPQVHRRSIVRYCYNDDLKNCETDGGLYDWNTAMNNSGEEGARGICPLGFHVPKDSEWFVLEDGLKDEGQTCSRISGGDFDEPTNVYCASAGTKLQVGGSSGFNAILAGFRNNIGLFEYRGLIADFWSSTDFNGFHGATSAWERSLRLDDSEVDQLTHDKADALSVRCLKD